MRMFKESYQIWLVNHTNICKRRNMEGVEDEFGVENGDNLEDKADGTVVAERTKKKKKKKKPNGMYLYFACLQ